jgi:hypothetical protein
MEVTPDLIPGNYTDPYASFTPKQKIRLIEEQEYKIIRRVFFWFIFIFVVVLVFFWSIGWIDSYQEGYVDKFQKIGFL